MAGVPLVTKIKKSLSGLSQSQSLENWVGTMDHCLDDTGFRLLMSDDKVGFVIPMLFHVYDLFLLGANKPLLNKFKTLLMGHFEMTDIGDVSRVLGMNVAHGRGKSTITIIQRDDTQNMKDYNLTYMLSVGPVVCLSGQGGTTICRQSN